MLWGSKVMVIKMKMVLLCWTCVGINILKWLTHIFGRTGRNLYTRVVMHATHCKKSHNKNNDFHWITENILRFT